MKSSAQTALAALKAAQTPAGRPGWRPAPAIRPGASRLLDEDKAKALRLGFHRLHDEADGIDVLHLAARAEPLAGLADDHAAGPALALGAGIGVTLDLDYLATATLSTRDFRA